jgi:two-component system, cell cycle response regulator
MTENTKPKILIAEDDAVSRRLLEAFAAKRGYEVITASNGEEALRCLSDDGAPRLAILDWMMPGMEGTEVCRRLRAQSTDRPYVYVLLLTARTEREDLLQGLRSGADDYVRKPFDPPELDARLRTGQRILDLQALRFGATHDALTGLANRSVILETLNREHSRQRREGGAFGIILADIDHFKDVNDTQGHLCGDDVLREVTNAMKESVRPYDTVGRYGGEEFLIVVPEADAPTALRVAERIRRAVESRVIACGESSVRVTASFGIAASRGPEPLRLQILLHSADEALYRAKSNGRNRCELSEHALPISAGPSQSGSLTD